MKVREVGDCCYKKGEVVKDFSGIFFVLLIFLKD